MPLNYYVLVVLGISPWGFLEDLYGYIYILTCMHVHLFVCGDGKKLSSFIHSL